MSELFNFWAIEEGLEDDPEFELRKPTHAKKKRNLEKHKKRILELKESSSQLSDLTMPIGRECDWGNREYKLRLVNLTDTRKEELITQMTYRLAEGKGQAFYMVGINDEGIPQGLNKEDMDESLSNLESMATRVRAKMIVLRRQKGMQGEVAEVMVNKREREGVIMDVRVILLGSGHSGKSTLIGVMTNGKLDNGKGEARLNVCKHRHEAMMGKTSSVSQHVLGFDSNGEVTNHSLGHRNSSEYILDNSSKIITFIDLAGSEKYLKSVVGAICSQLPDYGVLTLDVSVGVDLVCLEHLRLAEAMQLPYIVVLTKVDIATHEDLNVTLDQLDYYIKPLKLHVNNEEDVVICSRHFFSEKIVPVFQLSCVKGDNLDLLMSFLNLLPVSEYWDEESQTQFYVERCFEKEGVGTILGGVVIKGRVDLGTHMLLGPDNSGEFCRVKILGIHCKRVAVRSVRAGQFCSFNVTECGKVRSGMVLLDTNASPKASMEFNCEITPIDNCTETRQLKVSYKPLIHTQTIKQVAGLVCDTEDSIEIHPNQTKSLRLRFLYHPEYIEPGTRLMIKDTFMTAVGLIKEVS